jgi:hypothetical protein
LFLTPMDYTKKDAAAIRASAILLLDVLS